MQRRPSAHSTRPPGTLVLREASAKVENVEGEENLTSRTVHVAFASIEAHFGPGAVAAHALAELPPAEGSKAEFIHLGMATFRYRAAQVVLVTESLAGRFPIHTEHRLLSLLYSRAKAHKVS